MIKSPQFLGINPGRHHHDDEFSGDQTATKDMLAKYDESCFIGKGEPVSSSSYDYQAKEETNKLALQKVSLANFWQQFLLRGETISSTSKQCKKRWFGLCVGSAVVDQPSAEFTVTI